MPRQWPFWWFLFYFLNFQPNCAQHAWETVLQTLNAKPEILECPLLNDLQLFSDFELLGVFPLSHHQPSSCFRRINPPIFAIRLDPPSDCHIVCRLFLSLS